MATNRRGTRADKNGLEIEQVKVSELRGASYNPRKMADATMQRLMENLKEFGCVQPIIINAATGLIIGGHQRAEAANRLGWDTIPAVYVNVDPAREKALNLSLNALSGEWDTAKLADVLADVQSMDPDVLGLTGFDMASVDALLAGTEVHVHQGPVAGLSFGGALGDASNVIDGAAGGVGGANQEPNIPDVGDDDGTSGKAQRGARAESERFGYNLVFDDIEQQTRFHAFLKGLRKHVPDAASLGERVDMFLQLYATDENLAALAGAPLPSGDDEEGLEDDAPGDDLLDDQDEA